MKNRLKKIMVLGLSASLMVASLAGCSKKEEKTFDTAAAAITVNDDTISAGVVNVAVRYSQASVENLYRMYFGAEDPFNQDLFGTGQTLGQQALAEMSTQLSNAVLAEQHMEEYGVTLTDEEKAEYKEAAQAFIQENDAETLTKMGIDQESVERYLELTLIQTKMEPLMSADVDTEVSDEEAAQRRVQYVLFAPVSAEEAEAAETELETEAAAETETETEAVEAAAEPETEAVTEKTTEAMTEAVTEKATEAPTEAATEKETEAETAAVEKNKTTKTKSAAETELETEVAAVPELETEPETEDPETIAAKERAYEQAMSMLERLNAGEDMGEIAESMGKNMTDTTFGADYSVTALVEATNGLEDGTLIETPVESAGGGYYVVRLVSQIDREATDAEKEEIVEQRKQDAIRALYTEWTEASTVNTDGEVLAQITFDYYIVQPEIPETEMEEAQTE